MSANSVPYDIARLTMMLQEIYGTEQLTKQLELKVAGARQAFGEGRDLLQQVRRSSVYSRVAAA